MEKVKIIVEEEDNGIRIDSYLSKELNISRSCIQKQFENNSIFVNDMPVNKKYIIKSNDSIIFNYNKTEDLQDIVPKKMNLDIIYEDDDLLIINKQKGLVVHPGAGNYDNTLVNGLLYYTKQLSNINGIFRPGIVHRIDKDTSGLLVVCKNNETHTKLSSQLQDKTCFRKYICIVEGTITNNEGEIDAPIGRDSHNRQKMCVTDHNSKNAITKFKVLERFSNYTLIECELLTGRTHQIRVHMSYIKHPVVNDSKYNKKVINNEGQYLHAYYLSFIHPRSNERVEYYAPIPEYMKDFVKNNGGNYY